MVVANGFITENEEQAFEEASKRIKGKELRRAVMPPLCTMTYFVSDIGEMYGCQRMKTMCLTKPIRVESRYRRGCSIRYSIGRGNQANAFMQNVMYSTFVSGQWEADMQFTFRDGNPYNFLLPNIEPKKPEVSPVLMQNIEALQSVYRTHHLDVAWYIRKTHDIPLDDCKDIASDTFFYLCGFRPYSPDHFVGIWKQTADHRATDWQKKHVRCSEGLFWEDGEERFGKPDRHIETADIWGCIRGEKRKAYLRLWCEGETNAEIAKRTGTTSSNVRSEVFRAMKELKVEFRKDIAV